MCEDTAIHRMTDMESSESNDIDLDIVIPSRILFPTMVYSIPQNQLEVNAPIKLNVRVVQKIQIPSLSTAFNPLFPSY